MWVDSLSKCIDYEDFSISLNTIEKELETDTQVSNTLKRVMEFIENNQEIFLHVKKAAISLASLGTKIRHLSGNEQLIEKLLSYVKLLIPSKSQETKDFLQLIRSTIMDPSKRLQAIADWVDLMRIPLAQLELTEDEFIGLVTSLEYPDLTNFDFQSLDWKIVAQKLLNPYLAFKTTEDAFLSTLAKLCAEQNFCGTLIYIQKFGISDEQARVEIAQLCAQKSGRLTGQYIETFAIKNELARIEIAWLCAHQSATGTALNIGNFAITSEQTRAEIAQLCAKKDGGSTAEFFQNFGISDEQERVKIAKLCAQYDDGFGSTAKFIQNFEISNELERIEIAKLCAQYEGVLMVEFIGTPTDDLTRTEFAKLCANPACHIENFAITNEQARVEIAKICARQDGRGTAFDFQKFAIRKEVERIEIAKLCSHENGVGTAKYIENFQIANPHSLYQLFLNCVQKDPKSLFHMNTIPSLPKELVKIPPLIQILKSEALDKPEKKKELFEEIQGLIEKFFILNENRKTIFEMNDRIQALPPHVQNPAGLWLVSFILCMKEMEPKTIEWLLETGIWSELGLLKDPFLRVSLSAGLHALTADGPKAKLWEGFLSSVRGKEGQRGLMLLAIPLYNLQLQCGEESKFFAVANHLSALQRKKKSRYRNIHQVKNLLQTMHSLATSRELTPKQKLCGFEKIFFDGSTLINEEDKILNNVIAAKGLLQLKDTQWPNLTENLSLLFRSSLEKLIPLGQFNGDVSAKYEEIFATCRNPGGLLTYAAGLKTLDEPGLLSCLGQYVVWIMDKTFKIHRYDTTHNPHFAKVVEANPILLSKWIEEIKLDVETIISEEKKEDAFDSEQWLHTKLVVDKHLGSEKLPYFVDYIKTPSAEDRKGIFSALIKEIKELLNTLSSTKANDQVLINLNLQKACLRLVKKGKIADKKLLINHLEEIDHILHQVGEPHTGYGASEFAADVKGLLESLRKQAEGSSENKRDLKAIFTDDPIDLLLCGTDVSGSCQRVEGNPELNKGLLGYLIDGKNRLLAIKDGDKIVARSILRLLWDGQQPVVYRDRFYPDQIPAAHKQALNALAKQVSQKLALPLTAAEGSQYYNNTLQSLGSSAPYEYCDAAGGVQKEGRYTIQAHILD